MHSSTCVICVQVLILRIVPVPDDAGNSVVLDVSKPSSVTAVPDADDTRKIRPLARDQPDVNSTKSPLASVLVTVRMDAVALDATVTVSAEA